MKNGDWRINLSPSHRNEALRRKFQQKRREAIHLLGGKCVKCGYTDIRALQVDHINGDGKEDRKYTGTSYYYFIIKTISSGRFQVLCSNCNTIKRYENYETPLKTRDGPDRDKCMKHLEDRST